MAAARSAAAASDDGADCRAASADSVHPGHRWILARIRGRTLPDDRLVVRGHRVIGRERESRAAREGIHLLEVPDAGLRIARVQHLVERRIAR